MKLRTFVLVALMAIAAPAANVGFPFADEQLNYSINWPSGLSIGEGHLLAKKAGGHWNFSLSMDAGIPGFAVKDEYRAQAAGELCSSLFTKKTTHGTKKVDEATTVDYSKKIATRATGNNGGKTEIPVSDCAKDALTYLFWGRQELGQGRIPKPRQVLFGALYQANFEYIGAAVIRVNDKEVKTDKLICTLKGPASELKFEMFVARDAARTPVEFRVPLPIGTFSMELIQ